MRTLSLSLLITLTFYASNSLSLLVLPDFIKSLKRPSTNDQEPIMDVLAKLFPGSSDQKKQESVGLSISDVIGKEGRINIYAGFTRDVDAVSKRLDDNSQNTTVLAPLNSAIQSLPRKPWEDPEEYKTLGAQAYDGSGGEDRAYQNLKKFVEAHIVPVSSWEEGKKVETIAGNTIWWENKNEKKLIQPGDIEVSSVADKVAHGELWVIKGCLNYK